MLKDLFSHQRVPAQTIPQGNMSLSDIRCSRRGLRGSRRYSGLSGWRGSRPGMAAALCCRARTGSPSCSLGTQSFLCLQYICRAHTARRRQYHCWEQRSQTSSHCTQQYWCYPAPDSPYPLGSRCTKCYSMRRGRGCTCQLNTAQKSDWRSPPPQLRRSLQWGTQSMLSRRAAR